jgi:hypothetical protein
MESKLPENPDQLPVYDPTAIDWKEIEELRRIPGPEKVRMSLGLQELARRLTLAGIRHQNPDASEEEIHGIFAQRMSMFQ